MLGFGGYVSTPAYLAARRLRLPIVIHEQNVLPGLANKLAARFTRHVYTSFPGTPLPHAELHRAAAAARHHRAGPRRRAEPAPARRSAWTPTGRRCWSAAARRGRRASTGPCSGPGRTCWPPGSRCCTCSAPRTSPTRPVASTDPATGAGYHPLAYVDAMEQAYAAADLMLGRCGASTVLETAAVGLPAVFVPLPARQRRAGPQRRPRGRGRRRAAARRRRLHPRLGRRRRSRPCSPTPDRLARDDGRPCRGVAPGRRRALGHPVARSTTLEVAALMGLVEPVELVGAGELGPVHFIAIGGSGMNGDRLDDAAAGRRGERQRPAGLQVPAGAGRPREPGSTSATPPSSSATRRPSSPRRRSATTTPSSPRRGAAVCGCCTAARRSAR